MSQPTHFIVDMSKPRMQWLTLCGKRLWDNYSVSTYPDVVDCPKCRELLDTKPESC